MDGTVLCCSSQKAKLQYLSKFAQRRGSVIPDDSVTTLEIPKERVLGPGDAKRLDAHSEKLGLPSLGVHDDTYVLDGFFAEVGQTGL